MTVHLNSQADLEDAIRALVKQDKRLKPILDVTGMPASRVEVQVEGVIPEIGKNEDEGVFLSGVPPEGLRAWPAKTTTDDQGQILLNGIGRDFSVHMNIRDSRFARQHPRTLP